jgi:hypothetical protein
MKRTWLAILVGAVLIAPDMARADHGERQLVIVNHTKAELLELYTSPAEARIWGADQLGSLRIGVGGKVTVKLRNAEGECVYDLMMVFADGEKVRRREDVCVSKTVIVTEHSEPGLPSI